MHRESKPPVFRRLSFLDGGVADGSVVVLGAAHVLGHVVAPKEVSAVLLSKVVQLPGQERLHLQRDIEDGPERPFQLPGPGSSPLSSI